MKQFRELTRRNIILFFKDKGMFFTSLITPAILLVLYATFLGNIYKDSFLSSLPEGFTLAEDLINGVVGGQLMSSILAVSCVTVAFSSNMLMVQDKANGTIKDLSISPVKKSTLALSYYFATLISTLIICYVALAICLLYVSFIGWFISFADVMFLMLVVFLLVMFGADLSSILNFFLSSQGQIAAVCTIMSAGYGFICGAYMPISSFSSGLQKVVSFLPGTYGTSLVRNHSMNGAFREMKSVGIPGNVVEMIRNGIDCNLYFFDNKVDIPSMYIILAVTTIAFVGVYVALNALKRKP